MNPAVVQTLVVSKRAHAVLLGKWRSGALKGRFTGLLGAMHGEETPRAAAARVAASLVPQLPEVQPARLEPRAIFEFCEVPTWGESREGLRSTERTTELQYVYRLHDDEEMMGISSGSDNLSPLLEPQWFPLTDIPYDQMPADDREWYPQVLDPTGPCLTGSFVFRGRTLLRHNMEEISPGSLAKLERQTHRAGVPSAKSQ